MTEKEIGCDNCYYSYFDEKAYPCSLCVRGIERTDKWQPNKKTKADRKTEQTEPQKWETPPKFEHKGIITTCVSVPLALIEDEPQTETQTETQNSNENSNVILVSDGVSEAVRCAMCSNPNKSDRGCDGACSYDERLYKRIMDAIDESRVDTPQTEGGKR